LSKSSLSAIRRIYSFAQGEQKPEEGKDFPPLARVCRNRYRPHHEAGGFGTTIFKHAGGRLRNAGGTTKRDSIRAGSTTCVPVARRWTQLVPVRGLYQGHQLQGSLRGGYDLAARGRRGSCRSVSVGISRAKIADQSSYENMPGR